ncbi:ammonium transporter [Vaginisenegalia massiliensis]|uniref:ammonium transporter n=1 Tax=Vaginisenegalia massiliensis TaxID=2058294 RepID=UPI000F53F00B|nr:ammonium transporter [Vaginisenegalia massiliensis]
MDFIFTCIISMWLMIGAVGLFYVAILPQRKSEAILTRFSLALLVAILVWLGMGNGIACGGTHSIINSLDMTFLFSPKLHHLKADTLLNILFQMCFMLYAVVMLIGSVIDRMRLSHLALIVAGWILFVYAPLARWVWHPQGWLNQLGLVDFSGGLVVHLSAGLSAYVLASFLPPTLDNQTSDETANSSLLYLAVFLICFGWFGFNAGPVGQWNRQTAIVLINTFLAIVGGGLGWGLAQTRQKNGNLELSALLNGMVCGLVSSTAGIGSVTPLAQFITSFLVSWMVAVILRQWLQSRKIYDAVDSFGMNGIGGALGSLAPAFFAIKDINPHLQVTASWSLFLIQLLGIFVTCLLSLVITYLLAIVILRQPKIKEAKSF